MDEPQTSPTPSTPVNIPVRMSFYDALKQVVDGKSVTKLEWGNPQTIVFLESEMLLITIDGKDSSFIIREPDIVGTDWIVV